MSDLSPPAETSPTPILDREAPLPPPAGPSRGARILLWLWIGLTPGTSAALLLWRPPWLRSLRPWLLTHFAPLIAADRGALGVVWSALLAGAAVIAAVALHELAHLLVGVAAGFGFSQLRISRLQIDPPFRLSIYRGRGTGSGGWSTLFPVRQDRLVLRALAMVSAGPVVNLLCAAVLALATSPGRFASWFVVVSLVLGIVNLLPFRSRAVLSDGMRILMLLQDRARGERWLALMKLGAELKEGVLPESFSPAFLAKAVAVRDDSPDTVIAYSLAFSSAFHRHEDGEAARALEACLRYSGYAAPILREALMSDAGVFQARRRRRADLAGQWLAAMPEKTELSWLRPRVEAAIFEARGDTRGALEKLDEVERAVLAEPNPLRRDVSLRLTRRWQSELRSP